MPWCGSYSTCTQPAGLQTPTWQKTGSPLISAIGQRSQTDSFGRLGDRKAELDEGRRGRKKEAVAFFCDFSVQLSTCVSRNKEVKHTHWDVTVTPEDCPLRVKRFSSCVCVCLCLRWVLVVFLKEAQTACVNTSHKTVPSSVATYKNRD